MQALKPLLTSLTFATAALLSLPAAAATVDFEDVPQGLNSIYEHGQSFISGGFLFEVRSRTLNPQPGDLYGQVGDNASAAVLAPPANSVGQYYSGLNDGSVRMSSADPLKPRLQLESLEFSFLPFAPNFYVPGQFAGLLFVTWEDTYGVQGTETYDFGSSDDNGVFSFQMASGAGLGGVALQPVLSVTFFACTPDANDPSLCVNPSSFNDAWFALDNIRATAVPTPTPLALLSLAVVGLMVTRARKR